MGLYLGGCTGGQAKISESLIFVNHIANEEGIFAEVEDDDYGVVNNIWSNSLYLYIENKCSYYVHFNDFINRESKPKGKCDVYARKNGLYAVKFELEDDCSKVQSGDPWLMESKLIFLNKWPSNF